MPGLALPVRIARLVGFDRRSDCAPARSWTRCGAYSEPDCSHFQWTPWFASHCTRLLGSPPLYRCNLEPSKALVIGLFRDGRCLHHFRRVGDPDPCGHVASSCRLNLTSTEIVWTVASLWSHLARDVAAVCLPHCSHTSESAASTEQSTSARSDRLE